MASAESGLASNPEPDQEREEVILEESQQLGLTVSGDICPSCGSSALIYEEGCSKCYACGYSEC